MKSGTAAIKILCLLLCLYSIPGWCDLMVDGVQKASLVPHLRAECTSALQRIEAASSAFDLRAVICRDGESTLRMVDPLDAHKAFTELVIPEQKNEFSEILYPNSGNVKLKETAENSASPERAKELLARAARFRFLLNTKGEFDSVGTSYAEMHLEDRALGEKTARERLRETYQYYLDDKIHPKLTMFGEQTATNKVKTQWKNESTRDYNYRNSGGFSADVGSNIVVPGPEAMSVEERDIRAETYMPLVKVVRETHLCGQCAADFYQARTAAGQRYNQSLTAGPPVANADDEAGR